MEIQRKLETEVADIKKIEQGIINQTNNVNRVHQGIQGKAKSHWEEKWKRNGPRRILIDERRCLSF